MVQKVLVVLGLPRLLHNPTDRWVHRLVVLKYKQLDLDHVNWHVGKSFHFGPESVKDSRTDVTELLDSYRSQRRNQGETNNDLSVFHGHFHVRFQRAAVHDVNEKYGNMAAKHSSSATSFKYCNS